MPESYLTYAAFALVCLVLLTLPFVPAFVEWRRPTDLAALPVSANYTSDIDHFARRLHGDVRPGWATVLPPATKTSSCCRTRPMRRTGRAAASA